jgi:transposase
VLERRRHRAVKLLNRGLSVGEVARRLQTTEMSVHRWRRAFWKGGRAALAPKPTPGRPRRMSDAQRRKLIALLLRGAMANGFPNEMWTLRRMQALIRREFGIRYHPSHVWKVLRTCGWSCQVPERRALQRNEKAIERWKRESWPAIKKSPRAAGPSRVPRRKRLSAHSDAA